MMSVIDEAISYIRDTMGVVDVLIMEKELCDRILTEERSVLTQTKNDYRNLGYEEVMRRSVRLCVFYDNTFIFSKRSIVRLMTDDGTVMGTSLLPEEIPEYKKREDVIWISEDFIVFPEIVGKGKEAFVLLPFDIPELEMDVNGVINTVGSSPTSSSDIILKRAFGKPVINGLNTMIIAFDIIS